MTVLWGWLAVAALMTGLWARQLKTRNATSVDAFWALSIGLLVCFYALAGDGDPAVRALVAAVNGVWSFRLAWHLFRHRVRKETEEDGRYKAMREHWGGRAPRNFFFVYQLQAAVALLFSLPPKAAMEAATLGPWAWAGVAVALVALGGEALADAQLARWRADPANRGKTCRAGLWRYSRHPNYFFEWVHWFAYVCIGGGAWLTWLGPAAMLLFLFRLTGIPWTEKQARKSREDYEEYQRTTSVFIPWFPKEDA